MTASTTKTILIMANSIKKGGRCVAGLEITPVDDYDLGKWIRPVDSSQDEGTIPLSRTFVGNRGLKPLDRVKIHFKGPTNDPFHPEDYEIDSSQKWQLEGVMMPDILDSLPDDSEDLWGASTASSRKVFPQQNIKTLRLIKPQGVCFVTAYREDTPTGIKHRRLLHIEHQGLIHQFSIDDPSFSIRHKLSPLEVGDRNIRIDLDPFRTIVIASLTKPFKGYQYKIAATIFEL